MKTIWEEFNFEDVHLFKEIGEIPYYFSKIYGYNAIISGYSGEKVSWRGVKLLKRSSIFSRMFSYLRLLKNAKHIDVLYLIHRGTGNYLAMILYKLGGGKGKIYLKWDIDPMVTNGKNSLKWEDMPYYIKIFCMLTKNIPDINTVETKKAYSMLENSYYSDLIKKNKLYLLPNGFDPLILEENNIIQKNITEKERIIITVGRQGTAQKNTELFLEIVSKVDLKEWKVYLIGPQTDSFNEIITEFYHKNPEKRTSVFFTGPISQNELYDYYNRSRVFMFTSRSEGFAFVLLEAAYMQNYIISTDVGCMADICDIINGFSVDPEDENLCNKMVEELKRVINLSDDELNQLNSKNSLNEFTWDYIIRNNEGIQKLI